MVTNRVEAYDLAQEGNSNMTPIDILDAITFVSEAWKIVKSSTIKNCWKKTGILPDSEENDSDLDQDTIIDDDIDKITSEIQDIINELNLDDPITAERYIHIDDEIPIEPLSEDDIIAAIISSFEKDDNIEEDDKLEIDVISNKEALNSLEKIIQYCKNPPDDVSIDYAELKVLNALKSKINKLVQDNAKQTTLDSFITC